jgi:hypothetical protein
MPVLRNESTPYYADDEQKNRKLLKELHLCHGCPDLLELFIRHVEEVGSDNFRAIARMEFLDRDGLERSVLQKNARHLGTEVNCTRIGIYGTMQGERRDRKSWSF